MPVFGWYGQAFFVASMWVGSTSYIAYATYQVSPPPTIQITTVGQLGPLGLAPINVTSQVTMLGNIPWLTPCGVGNLGFGGFIYAAYLFDRALTSSDILAIVANPWSPNVTGIVAMYIPSPQYFTGNVTQASPWMYVIGTGSTWIDASGNGNNLTVVGTIYLISTEAPPGTAYTYR